MELTARSWILGMQLRKLRRAACLTAENVSAKWLNCSVSRIYSIEGGYRTLNVLELRGLVGDAYGRPDLLPRMEGLLLQVESGSRQPIKDTIRMHPSAMLIHELEPESTAAYGVILDQVPKLAQTHSYMVTQHLMAGYEPDEAEAFAQAGLERQRKFLALDRPPMTRIIITESALERAAFVDGQISLLTERAHHPALELMVISASLGPHFAFSSFTIVEFGEFPAILYLDLITGGSLVDDDEEIKIARNRWERLAAVAKTPEESISIIESRA